MTPDRLIFPQQLNLYGYVQNNPLAFVDPEGLDLQLAGNVQDGTTMLCDIVGQNECGRISVDSKTNQVSFDVTGLDLSSNEGASLVADLVGSSAKFRFSVGATVSTAGGLITITDPTGGNGIINLDINRDIRFPNGKLPTALPPTGIDGLVGLDPNARSRYDESGLSVPGWALAFHELAESFAKIARGAQYSNTTDLFLFKGESVVVLPPDLRIVTPGAHPQAVQRELVLRSQRPASASYGRAGGFLTQP